MFAKLQKSFQFSDFGFLSINLKTFFIKLICDYGNKKIIFFIIFFKKWRFFFPL